MGLSDPWANSLEIIALHPVKNYEVNPMVLDAPWSVSPETIYLRPIRKIVRDEPNGT